MTIFEVMRGGGSALFGSSAIAGTINIITKEPVKEISIRVRTATPAIFMALQRPAAFT